MNAMNSMNQSLIYLPKDILLCVFDLLILEDNEELRLLLLNWRDVSEYWFEITCKNRDFVNRIFRKTYTYDDVKDVPGYDITVNQDQIGMFEYNGGWEDIYSDLRGQMILSNRNKTRKPLIENIEQYRAECDKYISEYKSKKYERYRNQTPEQFVAQLPYYWVNNIGPTDMFIGSEDVIPEGDDTRLWELRNRCVRYHKKPLTIPDALIPDNELPSLSKEDLENRVEMLMRERENPYHKNVNVSLDQFEPSGLKKFERFYGRTTEAQRIENIHDELTN